MGISELKAVVEGMTDGPWDAKSDNALGQWLVYPPKERLLRWSDGKVVGPDEPRLYPLESTEPNAKGIAALRNHADAFLELWEACDGFISIYNKHGAIGGDYFCRSINNLKATMQKLENI